MATKIDEYVGIVKIDKILGHTLLLQDYTDYFYLRVEDCGGCGILKVRISRQGNVLKDDKWMVENDEDLGWVRWAQDLIEQNK